jgi:hypothetical protein
VTASRRVTGGRNAPSAGHGETRLQAVPRAYGGHRPHHTWHQRQPLLREGLANAQGYAKLFTVQVWGHRIGVLYLDDFHGQLVEAPAAHWPHAPQPTEWKLVPVQGYHFGR